MADVIFLVIMVAFFALAFLFVKACALIVGPDTAAERVDERVEPDERAAA